MSLSDFASKLPDFARDIRVNIDLLLGEEVLDDQRKYGTMLACAHVTGHRPLIRATEDETADKLTPEAANAARSAASVMTMNNVYYRFVHLASNKEYGAMPVKLRMNAIGCVGDDDEQRLLPVRPPRFEQGIWRDAGEASNERHRLPGDR